MQFSRTGLFRNTRFRIRPTLPKPPASPSASPRCAVALPESPSAIHGILPSCSSAADCDGSAICIVSASPGRRIASDWLGVQLPEQLLPPIATLHPAPFREPLQRVPQPLPRRPPLQMGSPLPVSPPAELKAKKVETGLAQVVWPTERDRPRLFP